MIFRLRQLFLCVKITNRMKAPSDRLNIVAVGVGGMGITDIQAVYETENIVALCDVDWKYSKPLLDCFPRTKKYKDFRRMFDEMDNDIDAVIVATPDHTHAIIAATAMTLGKHVYVQKPLTHSVYESRLLTKLAAEYNVATQMGNQGSSDDGVDLICEWIWNGEIGEVKKVECATNRPMWPQGLETPSKIHKIPSTLDWDLFIGPAKMRPYNSVYHPWNWRGWWDFGTGVLGDMGCHILHPAFKALKLGYPVSVESASSTLLIDSAPNAEHIKFVYPARESLPKVAFPEVEIHWYDGGFMPDRPAGFPQGRQLMGLGGGLTIFHGTKDTLLCGCYGVNPWLLSGRVPDVPKTIRRIDRAINGGHEQDWLRACKESPENRIKTKSDFSEAGPFNEMIMLGVLAVRLQALNKVLEWDGADMQFTNIDDDESIKQMISEGFTIKNGHPTNNAKMSEPVNAKEFASELIKHNYRAGWNLPAMP
ncbi:MAG: Gfo/Idh/MocA family oxidoreductase [Candidatus Azobacteroides sp.]|nr:Gfo/Idh/MocA family oxidoreductase [Candidatus Azobacteroides sp.]